MGKFAHKRLEDEATEHPSQRASLLSKLFFCWTVPLIWFGFRRELNEANFKLPPESDWAENVGLRLKTLWKHELKKSNPSLKGAVFRMFRAEYCLLLSFLIFQQCILRISIPVLLGYLIRYISGLYANSTGAVLSLLFILATFFSTITFHTCTYQLETMAMRIRISLTNLTYEKTLRLSKTSLQETGVGKLVNMISNDVNRFDRSMSNTPYIFACPLQLVLVGFVLWSYTGPACLSGIAFLIIMVPVSGGIGNCVGRVRTTVAGATDARVRLLSEVMHGMLLVKMGTWEKAYSQKMESCRSAEVRAIKRRQTLLGFNFCLFEVVTRVSILLTFLTYVLMDNPLTVESVFVTLSMYNIVSSTSAVDFPLGVIGYSEMMVSLARIQKVLLMAEKRTSLPSLSLDLLSKKSKLGISLVDVSACLENSNHQVLSNVSLEVRPGDLVGLIGSVGSGKSTVIQVILGEVPIETGSMEVRGTIAYASQEPCFFTGSVRENILFGRPFDPLFYKTVIEVCALKHDIQNLVHGDETLVGDSGINLSGGQKARISLARAVYSRADIYLLDDPLSAVDVRSARHLMDKCIRVFLRDKCVLLVTHQTQNLSDAQEVIALENGRVVQRGPYSQICSTTVSEEDLTIDDLIHDDPGPTDSEPVVTQAQMNGYGTFEKQTAVGEQRGTGLIKWKLYHDFFRAGNSWSYLLAVLLVSSMTQVFFSGSDLYLQQWTSAQGSKSNTTSLSDDLLSSSSGYALNFIVVYSGFVVFMFVFALGRALALFRASLKSSVAIHARLFKAIMRAPMRFFEVNSVGRVLNRFSNDIGVMDEFLPLLFYIMVATCFQILGSMILVVSMDPVLSIPSLVLVALFFLVRRVYVGASSQIRRFEGTARSPVNAQLALTLNGIYVVRAYKAEDMMLSQFNAYQNQHSSMFLSYLAAARWFQYFIEILADFYIVSILLTFVLFSSDSSAFGLAISAALTLTLDARVCMTHSTEIVNQIIAVERTLEYTNIKPEAPLRLPTLAPSWLQKGTIRLDNVSIAYENGLEVLKEISFRIRAGEKVGIVGRTGAGKSSLIACLFRIVEAKQGSIHISNVNTCKLGLHDLRSQLSILPQNPILFSGSLRQNLDPSNEHMDFDIWNALEAVQLEEKIRHCGQELSLSVSEGGSNFSHGEKQLICLARTILQNSKILILDEATANVDTRTDSIIQDALRLIFRDSTILTIAHRLDTVMDSDRIIALDAGRIRDFDQPSNLLRNPASFLYQLVNSTGPVNSEKLRRAADEALLKRRNPGSTVDVLN